MQAGVKMIRHQFRLPPISRDGALPVMDRFEKIRQALIKIVVRRRALQRGGESSRTRWAAPGWASSSRSNKSSASTSWIRAALLNWVLNGGDLPTAGSRLQPKLAVPNRQAQRAVAGFLRHPVRGGRRTSRRRQHSPDLFRPELSQPVIAVEIEMDMLVKNFVSGDARRAGLRQGLLRVTQEPAGRRRPAAPPAGWRR